MTMPQQLAGIPAAFCISLLTSKMSDNFVCFYDNYLLRTIWEQNEKNFCYLIILLFLIVLFVDHLKEFTA